MSCRRSHITCSTYHRAVNPFVLIKTAWRPGNISCLDTLIRTRETILLLSDIACDNKLTTYNCLSGACR